MVNTCVKVFTRPQNNVLVPERVIPQTIIVKLPTALHKSSVFSGPWCWAEGTERV